MESEDERVLGCLEKVELCMEKRMRLLRRMRKGYFKLGKARAEGRFGQISANRLPSELKATTRIRSSSSGTFEIIRGPSNQFEEEEEEEEKDIDWYTKSGLRRRRGEVKKKKELGSKVKTKEDVDLVHWFGLYAPGSLQGAQKEFIKSLSIAIEVANINREILREVATLYPDVKEEKDDHKVLE